MAFPLQSKAYRSWLLIAIIALLAFAQSTIPYIYAQKHTPPGCTFLGQVAYTPDQDMYFSFISQARDGAFLFHNKLTGIPNPPIFINLEFWLVGAIQHVTGISENAAYQVWRFLGILLLATGISMLAKIILPSMRRVAWAMALLLFSGGFGFIFAALNSLHLISVQVTQNGIIDLRYGLLPFQQIISNPHFSFPHGLILIAYAFFLLGEKYGKTSYYLLSGLFFTIIGLVRPYDIIPPVIIFPLFILLTYRPFVWDVNAVCRRLLPLFLIIPVFIYNIWLFKVNAIFKYWGQQGLNAGSLPLPIWHYLAYGVTGILAIIRLLQYKTNPLRRNDKFLLLWFGVTFAFIHIGRYIPALGWSPQIGVYLAVPLALLGCGIRYARPAQNNFRYYAPFVIIALCAAAGNISIVLYFIKNFKDNTKTAIYYAPKEEVAAWQWLKGHTAAGNVIVATTRTSCRIAKYTHASVATGHYSVTPRFEEMEATVNTIFSQPLIDDSRQPLLEKLNADYIYIGPGERMMNNTRVTQSPHFSLVYSNALVSVYKINRER